MIKGFYLLFMLFSKKKKKYARGEGGESGFLDESNLLESQLASVELSAPIDMLRFGREVVEPSFFFFLM